jgi:hypothetical protein
MPEETPSSPAPETGEPTAASVEPGTSIEPLEAEADASGGFREPHPEMPADFASHEAEPGEPGETPDPLVPEAATEIPPVTEPEPARAPEPQREPRREPRPERRPEPPRRKEWTRPSDFRPAAPTAITQAVEHATFIAEALKELHDQMDEILELVEVAERQKLADEREIEELRRALRRIQPQRQPTQPHHHPAPPPQRQSPRREESRRPAPEPREPREPQEKRGPAEPPSAESAPTPKPEPAATSRPATESKRAKESVAPDQPASAPPARDDEELPPHSD